eukprot:5750550-Pyramimonas_sp.AAC.1
MAAAHAIVADEGMAIDLLQSAPHGITIGLRAGIQRLQARRMLAHLTEMGANATMWLCRARNAVLRIRDHAWWGAPRCLVGGAMWPPIRKFAAGYADNG